MTREEASSVLDDYDVNFDGHTAEEIAEAFDVAFRALEQEPCEDAVSRKAVHDMLENLPITVEDKWFNWLQKACIRLADLPSVISQEPRKGHWIKEESPFGWDEHSYQCSECGRSIHLDTEMEGLEDYPYCHCGADMREVQEDDR